MISFISETGDSTVNEPYFFFKITFHPVILDS